MFILLKTLTHGSLYVSYPERLRDAKLIKMGSQIPLTIDPLLQAHFTRLLLIPVILLVLLLLNGPGTNWTNLLRLTGSFACFAATTPNAPEGAWVKPNKVQKKIFRRLYCFISGYVWS